MKAYGVTLSAALRGSASALVCCFRSCRCFSGPQAVSCVTSRGTEERSGAPGSRDGAGLGGAGRWSPPGRRYRFASVWSSAPVSALAGGAAADRRGAGLAIGALEIVSAFATRCCIYRDPAARRVIARSRRGPSLRSRPACSRNFHLSTASGPDMFDGRSARPDPGCRSLPIRRGVGQFQRLIPVPAPGSPAADARRRRR